MWIIVFVLAVICVGSIVLLYIQLCLNIRYLKKQLEEIERGSHIELTVNSRNKGLLALCIILNRVLTQKDKSHMQYEKEEKLLKQNIRGLAHDIRTPLTGAAGYIQLAGECGMTDADKRDHYLDTAKNRLAELEDMLEEMFLYTKLTAEDFALTTKRIQVLSVLSDCLLGLYARFEEKGISPQIQFEQEPFSVLADEEALRRIFLNLIQNALIHGSGDLYITQKGNTLVFENDIPEGDLPRPERMFDLFYKGESARRKGSSGLGLFIVKELMMRMGGEAAAEITADAKRLRVVLRFIQR